MHCLELNCVFQVYYVLGTPKHHWINWYQAAQEIINYFRFICHPSLNNFFILKNDQVLFVTSQSLER